MTHLDTPTARYLVGDVFERMSELEDGSVDLVMTSPPFLALRSYLPDDHPDKAKEIGSEATPAEFLDTLLRLTAEWGRLLAPHGSICVELGDTYSGGGGGDARKKNDQRDGWPLDKSLCGIPTLYAWSLAYGRNLLTGEPSPAGKWRVRNLVAWVRPNPVVGALGDKFRPATSYLTIATRARDRYFDLDAVRTELKPGSEKPGGMPRGRLGESGDGGRWREGHKKLRSGSNPAGAPPLDWWCISPGGYDGAHYAVYPDELCVKPIEAMCPRKVCTICGQPSKRIVSDAEYVAARQAFRDDQSWGDEWVGMSGNKAPAYKVQQTLGWTDCECSDDGSHWRPGHVLDPFAGSGTTLAVAVGHGRAATGIDIDERNADLARERIGMFLTVDHPSTEVAS